MNGRFIVRLVLIILLFLLLIHCFACTVNTTERRFTLESSV